MVSKTSKQIVHQDGGTRKSVNVRGLSTDTWRKVRAAAMLNGMTVGQWCEVQLRAALKDGSRNMKGGAA